MGHNSVTGQDKPRPYGSGREAKGQPKKEAQGTFRGVGR